MITPQDQCMHHRHSKLFSSAQLVLPGGVNSPVRAFGAVGGEPCFIRSAKGPFLFDEEGNRLVDYVASWGPMLLGHAHEAVVEAVREAAVDGLSFGCPTVRETQMAELICELIPSIEMVRMVNSGTEATMSAIRLARGVTGRSKVIKMIGCYHGHVDSLLVKAGSGVATLALPDSPGIPEAVTKDTLAIAYNDLEAANAVFERYGHEVAAVIVEPIAGNMGLVTPKPGWLEGLRTLTQKYGALLIFDEVMTGFRVAAGGAQSLYGVIPDLTTLGKIVGGGLPVGAYGGRRELMRHVAPLGSVYQAGTLSGNPLAMAAGIATLTIVKNDSKLYSKLETFSLRLEEGLFRAAEAVGVPIQQQRVGSMMGLFFTEQPVYDYATATASNTARYAAWFHSMLDQGFYFAPSQFETAFVSSAHTSEVIDATIEAAYAAFQASLGVEV